MNENAQARSTDPDTSHEAAASLEPEHIHRSQERILEVLYITHPYAMTDASIYTQVYNNMSPSRARTARAELVTRGWVKHDDYRTPSGGSRRHRTWMLTSRGFEAGHIRSSCAGPNSGVG